MKHLFVGSEGTLGLITELTLRLRGQPEAISAAVCAFETVADAVETVIDTIQCGIPMARIELLDTDSVRAVNAYAGMHLPEKPHLLLEFHGSPTGVSEDAEGFGAIAGLCALVFATVLAELSVVARTSALTLSVAATLKEVVTIGVAEEVFHDHLTKLNLFGLLLCLLGAQSYSMVKLGRTRKTPRSGFTPPPPPPHDHPRNGDLQPKRILGGGERWVRQD